MFCRMEFFSPDLLILSEDRICLAKIDADIFAHDTLYDTCNDFFLHSVVLIVKNFALFLTDLLKDDVLSILCCDTSEFLGLDLNFDHVSEFCVGIDLLCVCKGDLQCRILYEFLYFTLSVNTEITGFRIDHYMYIISFTEMVLTCLDQRLLDCSQKCILTDIFFFFQDIQSVH